MQTDNLAISCDNPSDIVKITRNCNNIINDTIYPSNDERNIKPFIKIISDNMAALSTRPAGKLADIVSCNYVFSTLIMHK